MKKPIMSQISVEENGEHVMYDLPEVAKEYIIQLERQVAGSPNSLKEKYPDRWGEIKEFTKNEKELLKKMVNMEIDAFSTSCSSDFNISEDMSKLIKEGKVEILQLLKSIQEKL